MAPGEINEIRRIRHEISEECGHDVHKVVAYYRAVESQLRESGRFRFEERSTVGESREATEGADAETPS